MTILKRELKIEIPKLWCRPHVLRFLAKAATLGEMVGEEGLEPPTYCV